MTYICAVTGEESGGKHYLLKNTDGPEELIAAETLLHLEGDANLQDLVLDLVTRIEHLEAALERSNEDQEASDPDAAAPAPAPAAAAPVKKAKAKVPAQPKSEPAP